MNANGGASPNFPEDGGSAWIGPPEPCGLLFRRLRKTRDSNSSM